MAICILPTSYSLASVSTTSATSDADGESWSSSRSPLNVTGEWAMVIRRFMIKTSVLKVFLIGTRKDAYRLSFRKAKVPDWVITAMNSIREKLLVSRTRRQRPSTREPRLGVGLILIKLFSEQ